MTQQTLQGFRLSPQQERLWLLEQGAPGAYRARAAIDIQGTLEEAALRRALEEVAARHQTLRTRFRRLPGMAVPVQVVEEGGAPIWQTLSEDRPGRDLDSLFSSPAATGGDGAPAEAALTRWGQGWLLFLDLPGLVADSASLSNLFADLHRSYGAALGGPAVDGPAVPYVQFAEWQSQLLESGDDEARDHWRSPEIADAPPWGLPFESATDGGRFRPRAVPLRLPAGSAVRLAAAAAAVGVGLDALLLGAWQALLSRLSGRQEGVVAFLHSGREHELLAAAVGLYSKWIPVPGRMRPEAPFAVGARETARLLEAGKDVAAAYIWGGSREAARVAESFPAAGFELMEVPPPGRAAGAVFSVHRVSAVVDRFRVKLSLVRSGEEIAGELQYDASRLRSDDARRLAGQLELVLGALAADQEIPVRALPLLRPAERHHLVVEQVEPAAPAPGLLVHQRFAAAAAADPDRPAVVTRRGGLTYGELDARANRLAHRLRRLGVGPEVTVALYAERSADLVAGLLGTLKAGGAYVPLDPAQPAKRLELMLDDARPRVLLTQGDLAADGPAFDGEVLLLEAAGEGEAAEALDPGVPVAPEQLAYVVFTSGSTGRPKGVAVEHRQLLHYLLGVMRRLDLPPGGSYATVSTFAADLGNTSVFPALTTGGCLHVLSSEEASDPQVMAEHMSHHRVDCLKIVPSHLEALLAAPEPRRVLPGRRLVLGGEASATGWGSELVDTAPPGCRVFNHYGPSETTVGVLTFAVGSGPLDPRCSNLPLGRPIPGTRVYAVDRRVEPVPRWSAGELAVAGASVSRGYLGRPVLTAARFVPDPFSPEPGGRMYRTGDLGRFLADGTLQFLGRVDRQVKFHGFRVELEEIRSVLNRHPDVRDSAVLVRRDPQDRDVLVAYYVSRREVALEELRGHLSEILLQETLPNVFVHLRRLPLTLNGKVNHDALPSLEEARAQSRDAYQPPSTPVEEVLAGLWSRVLGVDRVGVRDSFFALGGHSLIATQLVSRIRQVFGIDLALRVLFDRPTVAGLAASVEACLREGAGVEEPPIVPLSRDQPLPLSYAQERLWLMHQLEPGSAAYNIAEANRITGPLELPALAASLDDIAARHEVLRTRFVSRDGTPAQVIEPPRPQSLPLVDLSGLDAEVAEGTARRLAGAEAERPFDLSRGPLLRARLLRLGGLDHVLLVTLHHIVSDAWSDEILRREARQLYAAHSRGRRPALPELSVQYADYAAWQRRYLDGEVLEELLGYWRRQLQGAPEELPLPTDRPRPEVPTYRGASHRFALPQELSRSLVALSREQGVTPFMTLLAGFNVLLHRYTGLGDLVVGTDVANRNRLAVEGLIGFFVNNLVLRTDLSEDPTFLELLGRVRETTLAAYAHQDLPFDRLVAELRPRRLASRTPLFQVLFVVQNAPRSDEETSELVFSPFGADAETAKFDVALFLWEEGEEIRGSWKYSTDLFDADTVARMATHFERVLAGLSRRPEARLSQLEIETEMEKREREQSNLARLRGARRRSAAPPPARLVETEVLDREAGFPLAVRPAARDLDLAGWAGGQRDYLEELLHRHGAILFRGFGIPGIAEFERVAQAVCPDLYGDYGDLPPEEEGTKVYHSTPYPAEKTILFHNESSHLHRWPLRQFFYCAQPAREGGETPLLDCRRVYRELDPEIREGFERKKLMYVRNFTDGLDVSWQDFFKTDDRAQVEETCRKSGMELRWKSDGLETRQVAPAVARHPRTGDKVFFNQIQLHHVSCLDPEVRESMRAVFSDGELPRNVYYGDGSEIDDAVVEEIGRLYWELAVAFPWEQGDIILVDNMLTAHARKPFSGPRKIAVAMGELVEGAA